MVVLMAIALIACFVSGCSTFFTHNTDGAPITCRNYDYPHRVSKEDRSLTGLNVVLHCKPEGKYESIAVADAVWCDEENPMFQKGGPDLEGFDISMMDILPYECNQTGRPARETAGRIKYAGRSKITLNLSYLM